MPRNFQKKIPAELIVARRDLAASDYEQSGFLRVTTPLQALCETQDELRAQGQLAAVAERAVLAGVVNLDLAVERGWIAAHRGETLLRQPQAVPPSLSPRLPFAPPTQADLPLAPPESPSPPLHSVTRRPDMSRPGSAFLRRREAGFTLVELLVVVAIISILAGMLLPALEKAVDSAREVSCANNLKQFGCATPLYVDDFAGWLPAECTKDVWQRASWPIDLAHYLGLEPNSTKSYGNPTALEACLDKIAPAVNVPRGLFLCPATTPSANATTKLMRRSYGPTLNFALSNKSSQGGFFPFADGKSWNQITAHKRFELIPSTGIIMIEKNLNRADNEYPDEPYDFNAPHYATSQQYISEWAPLARHKGNKTANYLFAGGWTKSLVTGPMINQFDSDYIPY